MSQEESESSQILTLQASSSFEDDEEALEALVQLKELDFGETFGERDTQLDSDEGEGISITFYNEGAQNYLGLLADDDGELQISLRLKESVVNQAPEIINKILPTITPVSIQEYILFKRFDIPFHSLDIPIREESDMEVRGIRLRRDGKDYILQESDDGLIINMSYVDGFEVEDELSASFVEEDIAELERFVTEVL